MAVDEGHGPAEGRLAALEEPGEGAERQPPVLQLRRADPAAQVLDVDAVLGEERIVRELVGQLGEQDVDVLGAELGLALRAHLLPMLEPAFAQKAANRQVHRMVGRDHVDAPDVDLLLQQPVADAEMGAGVPVEILLLVRVGAELGVLVPAGVDEEDVAVAHFHPFFDHLGREDVELAEHVAQVHDHAVAVQPLQRDLIDGLALGDEVARRVQVRAHVVGGLDVLGIDPLFRLAFDVLDFEGRVERPEGDVLVEGLGEVVKLHCILLSCKLANQRDAL